MSTGFVALIIIDINIISNQHYSLQWNNINFFFHTKFECIPFNHKSLRSLTITISYRVTKFRQSSSALSSRPFSHLHSCSISCSPSLSLSPKIPHSILQSNNCKLYNCIFIDVTLEYSYLHACVCAQCSLITMTKMFLMAPTCVY